MKTITLSIIATASLISNYANAEDYLVDISFDRLKVSEEDLVIYGYAMASGDFNIDDINNEDEIKAFSNSIEDEIMTYICNDSHFNEMINNESYTSEIEVSLDTGEDYMVLFIDSCL